MLDTTKKIEILDLGLQSYEKMLQVQHSFFNKAIHAKAHQLKSKQVILHCIHEPVYTLGKHANTQYILGEIHNLPAKVYHTNRGGEITYHGYGQKVIYPIIDLSVFNLGIAQYIHLLENVVKKLLLLYNIPSYTLKEHPGVWVYNNKKKQDQKICAIGVRCSKSITMHGLALNISTDLSNFEHIVPCGIVHKGTASMESFLNKPIDFIQVEKDTIHILENMLLACIATQ